MNSVQYYLSPSRML